MKVTRIAMATVVLVLLVAMGSGCGEKVGVSDESERDYPGMKKAREFENANDLDGARKAYEGILDRDPLIARAHLALAFLLEKTGKNYAEAIYHFRRYLTLRPDTEKKMMIESHIRTATLCFVGTVFPNQAAMLSRMAEVEKENKALKIRVANLESQTVQLRVALAAARAKNAVKKEKTPP
ncbi:MAG: tetratricopeptide repeat protein [bacterium]